MNAALKRFRIVAWIVGTFLIALMFVAMPMKYFADEDLLVTVISPIHGLCYMVYLVLGFHLAQQAGWRFWPQTVGLLLGGTVPVGSFFIERWAHRRILEEHPQAADPKVRENVGP
jgi:integral membrane protein